MTDPIHEAAKSRALLVRAMLRRKKHVFLQLGAAFAPLRPPLLDELQGRTLNATEFATDAGDLTSSVGTFLLDGVEEFASQTPGVPTLGHLRVAVDSALDAGIDVCLISRIPRSAYPVAPGSSVLDDASFMALPLLGTDECLSNTRDQVMAVLPACGLVTAADEKQVLESIVSELGLSVLAGLDSALFERARTIQFADCLDAREIEALRGGGLLVKDERAMQFSIPRRLGEFSDAVANALAQAVVSQPELADVIRGLWLIERMIRRELRRCAIEQYGASWRKQVLHGDLGAKILDHAHGDVYPSARSISELRDPIEWLTLGELLEIARSEKFSGLKFDSAAWRRFEADVVPIRNRVSHMRLLKKSDAPTIAMWVSHTRRAFL